MYVRRPKNHPIWSKLPGEYPTGSILQGGLFFMFLLVWVYDTLMGLTTYLNHIIPLGIRLACGIPCLLLCLRVLKRSESELFYGTAQAGFHVRTGIYQYCRHPMYLGDIFFHIALGFLSISVPAWGIIGLSYLLYYYLAKYEERLLLLQYGDRYQIYLSTVPRFWPKFSLDFVWPHLKDNTLGIMKKTTLMNLQ